MDAERHVQGNLHGEFSKSWSLLGLLLHGDPYLKYVGHPKKLPNLENCPYTQPYLAHL